MSPRARAARSPPAGAQAPPTRPHHTLHTRPRPVTAAVLLQGGSWPQGGSSVKVPRASRGVTRREGDGDSWQGKSWLESACEVWGAAPTCTWGGCSRGPRPAAPPAPPAEAHLLDRPQPRVGPAAAEAERSPPTRRLNALAGWFSTFNWGHKRHLSQCKSVNRQAAGPMPGGKRRGGGEGSGGDCGGRRGSRHPGSLPCSPGRRISRPAMCSFVPGQCAAQQRDTKPALDSWPEPSGPMRQGPRQGPEAATEASVSGL